MGPACKPGAVRLRLVKRFWTSVALVLVGGALTLSSCGSSGGVAGRRITTTTVSSAEGDQVAAADNDCAAAATTLDSLTRLPIGAPGKLPGGASKILGTNFGLVEQALGKLSRVPVGGQEGNRVRQIDTLLRQSKDMMQEAVADARSGKATTGISLEGQARRELRSAEQFAAAASLHHCATAHAGTIPAQ